MAGIPGAGSEDIEAKIDFGGFEVEAEKELRGDIATIKAQLGKPTPSRSVISEAAKSLRSVLEGGVGGALATYIPGWIAALSVYAGS